MAQTYKLYYAWGACSLASHIMLIEAEVPFTIEAVNLQTEKTASGRDYYEINPRGAVPALEIIDEVLTQNDAILPYIGDLSDIPAFCPVQGSMRRARVDEAIGFCGDIHSAYAAFFTFGKVKGEVGERAMAGLKKRMRQLEAWLPEGTYWLGPFTQADAYAAVLISWAPGVGLDMKDYPKAQALKERVWARPSTKKALAQEEAQRNKAG
ncbi:glutathione binding-like protein [Oecophyllibacter saccharovorans]|uniref:Glutathione S-transferase n=1 Tax=Oecophyllibacter saccharovorans TaxID=2558360 RepID=A0A506UKN5_9PROT|nr:glutathione binding-like protein [Oecophyllibacter saccharovorans]QDH15060.1 glutathione S-transferase [Oecophyllibacter saccharovorans]TPW33899.1 glutathione S-transferase [Oecophyllibacter saccharovorans]TPW35242.1 glutathione S-transferase [Oecophyllibacter saccharovorans]